MKTLSQLRTMKTQADRKVAEAEGSLKTNIATLKEKFGCASLKEAKKLLNDMDLAVNGLEAEYTDAVEAFEEEFSDHV